MAAAKALKKSAYSPPSGGSHRESKMHRVVHQLATSTTLNLCYTGGEPVQNQLSGDKVAFVCRQFKRRIPVHIFHSRQWCCSFWRKCSQRRSLAPWILPLSGCPPCAATSTADVYGGYYISLPIWSPDGGKIAFVSDTVL